MSSICRILVFRFSAMGDIALAVPVVNAALEQNPHVHIDFIAPTYAHALFPKHERLKLFCFDKENKHKGIKGLYDLLSSFHLSDYDVIVDLHDVLRTKFLSSISFLKGKKVVVIDKGRKSRNSFINDRNKFPQKHTAEKYADVFRKLGLKLNLSHELENILFKGVKKENLIGIAPFARHEGKRINPEVMRNVADQLSEICSILVFGSKSELVSLSEWDDNPGITLYNGFSLSDELKKMASLQLMISMDSANMHLASLVGVPVVSIWGVTHPDGGFLGYGQSRSNVIQDESLNWRPTSVYGNKSGPKENLNGMKNISAEMIVEKVKTLLKTPENV